MFRVLAPAKEYVHREGVRLSPHLFQRGLGFVESGSEVFERILKPIYPHMFS